MSRRLSSGGALLLCGALLAGCASLPPRASAPDLISEGGLRAWYCSTTYPVQCELPPASAYSQPRFYRVQLGGGGISGYPLNITSPSNDECLLLQGPPWVIVNGSCSGSASTAWANITGGTNTTAAMLVGSGASLGYTSTGVVNANEVLGLAFPSLVSGDCLGNNGSTLSWVTCGSGGGITLQTNGTNNSSQSALNFVSGNNVIFSNPSGSEETAIVQEPVATPITASTYTVPTTVCGEQVPLENSSGIAVTVDGGSTFDGCQIDLTVPSGYGSAVLTGSSVTLGGNSSITIASNQQCTLNFDGTNWQVIGCTALSSGGGSSAFSAITTGTNTTATMTVGTGGTMTVSGSGVNNANEVNGAAPVTSATCTGTNSSGQIVACSTVTYLVDEGTTATASGTGACATLGTPAGGTSVAKVECTGTTGTSTITFTLPNVTNGIWVCQGLDTTTPANSPLKQTAYTATSVTFSGTVNADDIITLGSCSGS